MKKSVMKPPCQIKRFTIKNKIIKYIALFLLIIVAIFSSMYVVILTPLLYDRKTGIFFTEQVSLAMWKLFSIIFRNTIELEIENEKDLDKIKDYESCVVIGNHIGAFDFMIVNEISQRKKMLKHSKYMIKESVKYIPILGYIRFLGFILMKRKFEKDRETIIGWLKFFKKNLSPLWFVIYPEGSRFTPNKLKKCVEYCKLRDLKPTRNVLYPRSKGFDLTIDELRDSYITKVIDLTVYYQNHDNDEKGIPSLFYLLFFSLNAKIKVRVDVEEIKEIDNPESFLIRSFNKKDQVIDRWKSE